MAAFRAGTTAECQTDAEMSFRSAGVCRKRVEFLKLAACVTRVDF